MPRRQVPGIFCFEGRWAANLADPRSVRHLLDFLKASGKVNFIYRDVNTIEELSFLVHRWTDRQYARYSLGYFGFHGKPGHLVVGRKKVSLGELGDLLKGKCAGRTIYFGSCEVFNIPKRDIREFRRQTRARCVAGYTTDVDWFEASAFDLLLFEALTWYRRMDAVEDWLKKHHGGMVRRLGFEMYYG